MLHGTIWDTNEIFLQQTDTEKCSNEAITVDCDVIFNLPSQLSTVDMDVQVIPEHRYHKIEEALMLLGNGGIVCPIRSDTPINSLPSIASELWLRPTLEFNGTDEDTPNYTLMVRSARVELPKGVQHAKNCGRARSFHDFKRYCASLCIF